MDLTGKTVGNYVIKSKLGAGGMGTVYLCEHPLIGKKVALKVLHDEMAANPQVVERFFQEAKAAADIGHENIIDVLDFGRLNVDGREVVYLMMEFLGGESLAHRLHGRGLSIGETLQIVSTCCSALAASHAHGIVHRDIKPENIHLCVRGSNSSFVKVLDFGIAKLTHAAGSSQRTRVGAMLGTPAYMSPEQCEGKGQVDHRADIYSLGIVMYELLTGRVPFLGDGYGEVLIAHLMRPPEPPSKLNPAVSAAIEAIVLHALEKDREARFQTMDEFAAAIADPPAHYACWSSLPHHAPFARSGNTLVLDTPAAPPPFTGPTPAGTPPPFTPLPAIGPTAPTLMPGALARQVTTLSGASAEVAVPAQALPTVARGHRRGALIAIAAAIFGVVAAGVLVFVLRASHPPAERRDEVPPAASQPPATSSPAVVAPVAADAAVLSAAPVAAPTAAVKVVVDAGTAAADAALPAPALRKPPPTRKPRRPAPVPSDDDLMKPRF